jgi:MFS family permease
LSSAFVFGRVVLERDELEVGRRKHAKVDQLLLGDDHCDRPAARLEAQVRLRAVLHERRGRQREPVVRVPAIAILTWPAPVAPILGPPVGGWISTHWSRHWIFLLNLPLGVAALAAALVLVRNGPPHRQRFDSIGFVLSALGFGLFMAGIEAVSRADVARPVSLGVLAGGIALLLATMRYLRRAAHPLFGLQPLSIRTFRLTAVGGSFFRTAIGTAPFLLPLMFQIGFGYSAVQAGSLLLWLFAGNLAMKPGTTRIMNRFGFRKVLLGNGLLVATGFFACALLTAATPWWLVCSLLFCTGMTRSMQFTALNTIGFADVPQPQMRDATTLFSVLQQMNAGMGNRGGRAGVVDRRAVSRDGRWPRGAGRFPARLLHDRLRGIAGRGRQRAPAGGRGQSGAGHAQAGVGVMTRSVAASQPAGLSTSGCGAPRPVGMPRKLIRKVGVAASDTRPGSSG